MRPMPKKCQMCKEANALHKERYCEECRKAVLAKMKDEGFFTPYVPGVFNETRGRTGMRSSRELGHECREDDYDN